MTSFLQRLPAVAATLARAVCLGLQPRLVRRALSACRERAARSAGLTRAAQMASSARLAHSARSVRSAVCAGSHWLRTAAVAAPAALWAAVPGTALWAAVPGTALWAAAPAAALGVAVPLAALPLMLAAPAAQAHPGAHGPNGEHLDAPAAARPAAWPRLEAHTEAFELVAEWRGAELVLFIDRYETNEPVLGATLEVESGSAKAVAVFRPETGDYAVTDAALLQALAGPGEHALVFTLVAAGQADLLDGTLVTQPQATGAQAAPARPGPGHAGAGLPHGQAATLQRAAWIGGGIAALALLAGGAWWMQRRHTGRQPGGAL